MRLPSFVTSTPSGSPGRTLALRRGAARGRSCAARPPATGRRGGGEEGARRAGDLVDGAARGSGEVRRHVEGEAVAEAEVHLARGRLLGHRDARDAEEQRLERGGDRAAVCDVVAEVRPVVDARDDEVGREALDEPEPAEPDTVD